MQTLGLLGGMAWPSTVTYYRRINEGVAKALGGANSASLLLWSANFADIEALQHAGDWSTLGQRLADAARGLADAGAERLVLCTNTMHAVAPAIEAAAPQAPLLHIADATAAAVRADGRRHVALLGTRFTMEQAFLRERLEAGGLSVQVPHQADRDHVHRIIYDELIQGRVTPRSRAAFAVILEELADRGAEAAILGCTELGLLGYDGPLPTYDTARIHAGAAVVAALGDSASSVL